MVLVSIKISIIVKEGRKEGRGTLSILITFLKKELINYNKKNVVVVVTKLCRKSCDFVGTPFLDSFFFLSTTKYNIVTSFFYNNYYYNIGL